MSDLNKNVFINCPYDKEYQDYQQKLIFTIISLEFTPQLAMKSSDGGTLRYDKIVDLIKNSFISIHDLSRIKPSKEEFCRMNMPFELGLDFGCRKYSENPNHNNKKYLILGKKKYSYMKALSDISGMDIKYYNDKDFKIIESVRHWFIENTTCRISPSPSEIWYKFIDYNSKYYDDAINKGYSKENMFNIPIKEQITYIKKFLESNPY